MPLMCHNEKCFYDLYRQGLLGAMERTLPATSEEKWMGVA